MKSIAEAAPLRIPLSVTSSPADSTGGYVRFSIPLPRNEWHDPVAIRIVDAAGTSFPVQTRSLASWPDGSLRMLHCVAPLKGGAYTVEVSGSAESAEVRGLVVYSDGAGGWVVENGNVRLHFGHDSLLEELRDNGRLILDGKGLQLRVTGRDGTPWVSYLESAEAGGAATMVQSGPLYIKVERWARAVLPGSNHFLRFRIQFEFYSGTPGLLVNAMLVNDCPGADFQDFESIYLDVKLADPRDPQHGVFQKNFGFEGASSRFFETKNDLDIRVTEARFFPFVFNVEALEDPNDYPHYLRPPLADVENAVFLRDGDRSIQLQVEDFHLLRPKGIDLSEGRAALALWPAWAKPLSLQQGRRRQVRIAISFRQQGSPQTLGVARAMTAALLDVERAQLPSSVYASSAFFDQNRVLKFCPRSNPRFEGWLNALSRLKTVATFFDLGDTPDSHYITTYLPLQRTRQLIEGEGEPPLFFIASERVGQCLQKLDCYEPIWVNNEYDVLFCLGTEYLRTSNLLLFRKLRWFSRHTIEVDFLCYSDHSVHHRSQPAHSEKHTSTGAYPSHFWTQGLTQYYFLTGDEDALEVIRALAEKTIWYFEHPVLGGVNQGINREMGWAVLTLLSAFEATGDPVFDRYARKLIDAGISEPLPGDLPLLSFGHTSLLLGCRAYWQIHHGDQTTKPVLDWFLNVVDLAICSSQNGPPTGHNVSVSSAKLSYDFTLLEQGDASGSQSRSGVMSGFAALDCLAFAYEITRDRAYLRSGLRALEAFLDGNPGYFDPEIGSFRKPLAEGKPFAVCYRNFVNYLGALQREGWLGRFEYQSLDLKNSFE